MTTRLLVIVVLALLFGSSTALAGLPKCDSEYSRSVVDALLNRDLTLAQEKIGQWQQQRPDHISLSLHEALVEVARADYSANKDPAKYDDALTQLADVISEMRLELESEPTSYLARLNLATALAVSGRLLMEQKHWLKAYHYGHESREIMLALLTEDPARYDTYLILGLFDYFTGSLPKMLRWLSHLIDFSGDAERGIQYLENAVEHANVASPQAAEALLVELNHTPEQACRYVQLARQMRRQYPANPRYSWAVSRLARHCRSLEPTKRPSPIELKLAAAECH